MGDTIAGEYDGFAIEHESSDVYEYVVDDDGEGFPSFRLLQNEDEDELVEEDDEEKVFPSASEKKQKRLKQGNLLDIWGIKRPQHSSSSSSPSLPPPRKKTRTGINSEQDIVKLKPSKTCPFYKKIPGTPFSVDAFRYGSIQGCSAYFLTHFHSDHYGGLTKGWSHGPIYCSPLTARLLTLCLSVDPRFIRPLEFNAEYVINGVCVTFLDANHCPGAILIHFRLTNGQTHLHTGDFRACKAIQTHPLLANQRVNVLYLDTTYCNPKYKFPSKEDVSSYTVRITENYLKKQTNTLVVVGAYSIGKECVYLAISEALGVKIYANARRRRILHSFGWPELSRRLCAHGTDTFLHVLPMSCLQFESLKDYLKGYANQYKAVLAFRPTGWTYSEHLGNQLDRIRPSSKGNITIYGVPYSEHSSFTELQEFVQVLRPDKIIPTVNFWNPANRDRMQSYFQEWRKS